MAGQQDRDDGMRQPGGVNKEEARAWREGMGGEIKNARRMGAVLAVDRPIQHGGARVSRDERSAAPGSGPWTSEGWNKDRQTPVIDDERGDVPVPSTRERERCREPGGDGRARCVIGRREERGV